MYQNWTLLKLVSNTLYFLIFSILLERKAPVDCVDKRGYTPLFNACKVASLGIIYELIRNGADVNHKANKDANCKTPIFKARTAEVVTILLKHGADPFAKLSDDDMTETDSKKKASGLMRFTSFNVQSKKKPTSVIKHLMKFNSECAKAILDNCLTRQQDDQLILDFRVFDPPDNENKTLEETEKENKEEMVVFNHASKYDRRELFLHPLMQIYLFMKVRNYRFHFWMQFLFKVVCAVLLTYFGITYADFNHCKKMDIFNRTLFFQMKRGAHEMGTTGNGDCFTMYNGNIGCHINKTHSEILNLPYNNIKPIQCKKNTLHPTKYKTLGEIGRGMGYDYQRNYWVYLAGIITLAAILIGREVIEFIALKRAYISREENYLQWTIIAMMISFISTSHNHIDTAQHLASWMVFFAWLDITLLLGEVDRIGECVYMSIDVMKNMLLCFSIYVPSLLGFSYGFYILINPTESFNSWFGAMVKVMAMSIGELDYTTNFDYHTLDRVGGKNFSSQVMIICFIFTIALVMMNVLLAVTLSKTEDLENKSKIMQSERMVKEIAISQMKHLRNCFSWCKWGRKEFKFSRSSTRKVKILLGESI